MFLFQIRSLSEKVMNLWKVTNWLLFCSFVTAWDSSISEIEAVIRGVTADKVSFNSCRNCRDFSSNCVSGGDGHTCCTNCICFDVHTFYSNGCYKNPDNELPTGWLGFR